MELTHIKYFLEVARTEHVTQSARNLCIVQPALTHAIHKLEDELGVKLFKTSGRNIKLTEALPARLRAKSDKQAVTISVKVLAASSFVANAIIQYKKKTPGIRFYLVQKEESTLYDICVQTFAEYRPQENPDEEVFVCTEEIFLAVPNNAQYKKRDSISLHELGDTDFIGLYGSKQLHKICSDFCDRIGFKSHDIFESDNALVVKDAIASGLGVGFWPEFSWGKVDSRKIRLLKITDADFKRDIVITYRRIKQDNSHLEKFYKFLIGQLSKKMGPGKTE